MVINGLRLPSTWTAKTGTQQPNNLCAKLAGKRTVDERITAAVKKKEFWGKNENTFGYSNVIRKKQKEPSYMQRQSQDSVKYYNNYRDFQYFFILFSSFAQTSQLDVVAKSIVGNFIIFQVQDNFGVANNDDG